MIVVIYWATLHLKNKYVFPFCHEPDLQWEIRLVAVR